MEECWNMLTQEDQAEYYKLKEEFKSTKRHSRKDKSTEFFQDIIDKIGNYVIRNDVYDKYRAGVVGIIFLGDYHLINANILSKFVSRSNTTINACYRNLGYEVVTPCYYISQRIVRILPFLKNDFIKRRNWTCRKKLHGEPSRSYWHSMYRLFPPVYISEASDNNENENAVINPSFNSIPNNLYYLENPNTNTLNLFHGNSYDDL